MSKCMPFHFPPVTEKASCPDKKDVFHQVDSHCEWRHTKKALHIISFDTCEHPEKGVLAPQFSDLCAQAQEVIF